MDISAVRAIMHSAWHRHRQDTLEAFPEAAVSHTWPSETTQINIASGAGFVGRAEKTNTAKYLSELYCGATIRSKDSSL